jgi:hypothetical protein
MMMADCYKKPALVSSTGTSLDEGQTEEGSQPFLYDETEFTTRQSTSCPQADDIKNACSKIIDASMYIGTTFDITVGYQLKGYRNGIILYANSP